MCVETLLSGKIQNGRHMFLVSKNTHDTSSSCKIQNGRH